MCYHIALCLMSFAELTISSILSISFFRFYYYLIVHISSYITVYDMRVLSFGIIKNNNNNYYYFTVSFTFHF